MYQFDAQRKLPGFRLPAVQTPAITATWTLRSVILLAGLVTAGSACAQSVCLPAPRLMTTMPMGGQAGTTFEVTITGQHFEDVDELMFSHPGITAVPKTDDNGLPVANKYMVTIAADCPPGIHEARAMTRLGISSSRVFNVSTLPEAIQSGPNTSLDKAMTLQLNSICNATMTRQAVDYYTFEATKDQRIVVDCATRGIDSKLNAVLIVADSAGNDLKVERRGGAIDFTAPEDGTYVVKVHGLTFDGGPYYFYRLALLEADADQTVPRLPSTETVSSFSWPPAGLTDAEYLAEVEPNNQSDSVQKITLPCNIKGSFFPAADVDTFEFEAKKGEVWWVEVVSERFGLQTDPSIVVQHVTGEGADQKQTDLVELTDIASPVKISSNGYSYDGPPYNAGSSDILGKIEIKEDGIHRLQISDLFGGTRNDPGNVYQMIIRRPAPDFAIVGWALHMNLRNGDRNALSKPFSLRGGTTMPIEVIVIRRDGFNDEINLAMDNLPEGVTATGLTIPKGQSRGIMLLTAAPDAPRGLTIASFTGSAQINGETVVRSARMASMKWPVPDASGEIPDPRLLADIPVAVCGSEQAPVTVAAAEDKVWEVTAGESLTIPLQITRRCEFSGNKMSMKTYGSGFEGNAAFDVPLDADASEAVLDLAKLKTTPGDYTIAFYGSAVAKYSYHPQAVTAAEAQLALAKQNAEVAAKEAMILAETAKSATEEQMADAQAAAAAAVDKQKAADAAVAAASKALEAATNAAKPKDIVDIVVSTPIRIRVNSADK
jgi:hypothetical protein